MLVVPKPRMVIFGAPPGEFELTTLTPETRPCKTSAAFTTGTFIASAISTEATEPEISPLVCVVYPTTTISLKDVVS